MLKYPESEVGMLNGKQLHVSFSQMAHVEILLENLVVAKRNQNAL